MVDSLKRFAWIAALICLSLCPASAQQSIARDHAMGVGTYRPVPPNAPTPPFTLKADEEEGLPSDFSFSASGHVDLVGGSEFELKANEIGHDSDTAIYRALGNVSLRELDTDLYADSLFFNSREDVGIADNILLRQPPYTIQAQRLTFRQGRADAINALFTTCMPGMSYGYSVRARMISLYALRRMIIIRHAAFYVRGTRLLTIGRIALTAGRRNDGGIGPASGQYGLQTAPGYTSYNGPFLTASTRRGSPGSNGLATVVLPARHTIQASLSGSITLIHYPPHPAQQTAKPGPLTTLREIAEETEPILPVDDPLLFHDFINDGPMYTRFDNRPRKFEVYFDPAVSYRQRIYGRPSTYLFLTRVPEASLNFVMPLLGTHNLPTDQNPEHVRDSLRKLALYAYITPQTGYYHEYPTDVSAARSAVDVGLDTRPLLVADNTLFRPRIVYQSSSYTGTKESFDYLQYDLALEHYFTNRTGIGAEYIQTFERGSSPFEFDTPYTTHEVDGRAQIGTSAFIVGALLKYDLHAEHLYQTQLVVGPNLGCLIPELTYDSQTDGLGIGLEIPGITF